MSTISFQIHPSFRPHQQPKIDRPNSRLYGIVAGMDVEATGHGVCCDVKSLELIAELANQFPEGVSGRFGHPGMSENATGRKVHLAYNWRVLKGEKPGAPGGPPHTYLVHDSQLMDAARTSPAFTHDPIAYIMNMAEQHPKHFAESLVLSATQVWTTKDGKELPIWEEVEDADGYAYKRTPGALRARPENALTQVPVLRPTAVHFCDFVNDGAITHTGLYPLASSSPPVYGGLGGSAFSSIFTEDNAPNYLLDHLFATVDDLRRRFNIPLAALQPKVKRLLRLYVDSRQVQAATATMPSPAYFHVHPTPGDQLTSASYAAASEQAARRERADAHKQSASYAAASEQAARRERADAHKQSASYAAASEQAARRKRADAHKQSASYAAASEQAARRKRADAHKQRKDDSMSTRRQRLARHRARPEQRQELAAGTPLGAEPAVDLSEQEELTAATDEALGHASAILTQAEQMANSMVQSTVALTDAPTLASAAQVAHLQEQLDQHTDQLHDLTTHLKKLSELLVKNMELTNVLQRNIARANGETVVTQRVPVLGATGSLEAGTPWVQFQQPAPGAWAAGQQPISTDQRRDQLPTGLDPDSPEARTIRRQQQRAQQTRQ